MITEDTIHKLISMKLHTMAKTFREILSAVEDAQLEGSLHDREEALSFVLGQFPLAK